MSTMPDFARAVALLTMTISTLLSGCTERIADAIPAQPVEPTVRTEPAPLGRATASVRWGAIARDFVTSKEGTAKPNQGEAYRAFAYLSLAQYRGVEVARASRGRPPHASAQGAVAAASAVLLGALFPAGADFFDAQLTLQENELAASEAASRAFAAGEVLGRSVGMEVVQLARTDGFDTPWTGTVPTGPGRWSSDFDPPRAPLQPLLGQMRPFFMESANQFRPAPPPAFGSAEYLAALAEIRRLSDTRTAEQLGIAQFWAMTTGSLVAGFWNEEASKLIEQYHLDERRAAHALALTHMAGMDAIIACHDAKFTYWLIRPYRADPGITTPIPRPQHPSYPSNHACVSGTSAYVLGALFPADATRLAAMADEAGESRLFAGIHYRFDKDAGLGIARQVAALALRRDIDRSGHQEK